MLTRSFLFPHAREWYNGRMGKAYTGRTEEETNRTLVENMLRILPNEAPEGEFMRMIYDGVRKATERMVDDSTDRDLTRQLAKTVFREARTGKRKIPEGVTEKEYFTFRRAYYDMIAACIGL